MITKAELKAKNAALARDKLSLHNAMQALQGAINMNNEWIKEIEKKESIPEDATAVPDA